MASRIAVLNNQKLVRFVLPIVSVFVWIGIWAIAAKRIGVPFILPTPGSVFFDFFSLFAEKRLYVALIRSLGSLAAGFGLGVVAGILFAVPSALSKIFNSVVSPIFTVIRATPVASFIIIAWVFLSNSILPGFICFLMTVPIIWSNLTQGIRSLDPALFEVARVFRFPFSKTFRLYLFPSLSPFLSSGLSTALGLGWKATIAAEILVRSPETLGYWIWDAKAWNTDTSFLFAWTLVVILFSILFDALVFLLFRKNTSGRRKRNV